MVTLVVSMTTNPTLSDTAFAILSMAAWSPGPLFQGVRSFVYGGVRLLKHDKSIVVEDDLDTCWEEATDENADNVIFLSKHATVSNCPALIVHPIGVPHLKEREEPPQGGRPGWAAPPDPRMGHYGGYSSWSSDNGKRVLPSKTAIALVNPTFLPQVPILAGIAKIWIQLNLDSCRNH
ncbi:hypothetical protein Cgig2_017080 [Carnegiea gigantea]|uniref:Uncharacterized protein n=1 Tax=Carnegiea gigantea TaxID=171969 RepID=A0A9Q1Q699_9CARY|nr:hypothetical protein Cgig2_017080 [Carnegiea gigantea]